VPPEVLVVAESGIRSHADVVRLGAHADAFLVGSSLMAAPHIGSAARGLVHGHVKICGLTNIEDAELAAAAGASHAGVIFVEGSARYLDPDGAEPLFAAARIAGLKLVGVFRDQPGSRVADLAARFSLDAIQLHGREDDHYVRFLRGAQIGASEIWDVCQVGAELTPRRAGCDRLLFDTLFNGQSGGTGRAFDWSRIGGSEGLAQAFLAGGIGPDNVKSAKAVGAYGLDIGSRVESAPGRKDRAKVNSLFVQLRPAARGDRP
jgi:indole-3-glycerol phosphate synthase/phosphoribosylanthranilate isomerase